MNVVLSVALGLGLAAACGFRVFLPLLVLSVASYTGHVHVAHGFEWIAGVPAIVAFSTATLLEVVAYYTPWMDHVLDLAATPAALVAGVIASASVLADFPPLVTWTVALIGGGGLAGLVQGGSVLTRLKSTATTGGLANPAVATGENVGAAATALLAVFLPLVCLVLVALGAGVLLWLMRSFLQTHRGSRSPHATR